MAKSNMSGCPCGTCVTCDCAAIPKMDEDGLCASCGGQSLLLALLDGPAPHPHIGVDVEGDIARARVAAIIAEGISAEALAPYLRAIDEDEAEAPRG